MVDLIQRLRTRLNSAWSTMVQRPFKSHETCQRHPCGQAGQPKPCGSNRHDIQAPRRTPSAMPSSMSSLHDNKRTGQWRHKASTIAKSVSHLRMLRSTPRFGGARRDRTDDLKLAKLALSQLSYGPVPSSRHLRPLSCRTASAVPTAATKQEFGWPEWTRTTDLTLIRRVL